MINFLKELLTPKVDTISFGRFMSLLITVFVLGWDTSYIVFAWHINHHLPTGFPPVDVLPSGATLLAQGGFCTLFYAATKTGDVLTSQPPKQQ